MAPMVKGQQRSPLCIAEELRSSGATRRASLMMPNTNKWGRELGRRLGEKTLYLGQAPCSKVAMEELNLFVPETLVACKDGALLPMVPTAKVGRWTEKAEKTRTCFPAGPCLD
eukprot:TRINITY_DN3166_c0_g1_i1.p2 TRINITY_DN3166_c0_g1~~TRINITY_DN3166_c0_g1_i1.p2  ORF type:complete len:113 (-),score=15.24 TRINITY_DN3166_c0_g1_i1:148-486(-)